MCNRHVWGSVEDFEEHGSYGFWVWTDEGRKIRKVCAAMHMKEGNTVVKKREIHPITYKSHQK